MRFAAGIGHANPRALEAIAGFDEILGRAPAISWAGQVQPVALHRARVVFSKRTARYNAYNEDADETFRQELRLLWRAAHVVLALDGPLAVVMTFAGQMGRRGQIPDVSNLVKAVEDAGNPSRDGGFVGLWDDDRQIKLELAWIRSWTKKTRPLITLDVWRLGDG